MSLVPNADDNGRPRVIPKVFADVPSAGELAAVQSSRNTMAAVAVLMVVLLIPAVGGCAWLGNQYLALSTQVADQTEQIDELQKGGTQKDADLAAAKEAATKNEAALKEKLATYSIIDERLAKTDELRKAIAAGLEKKPGAEKVALKTPAARAAYQTSGWLVLRDQAEKTLAAEVTALEKIDADVKAWAPIVDPRQ